MAFRAGLSDHLSVGPLLGPPSKPPALAQKGPASRAHGSSFVISQEEEDAAAAPVFLSASSASSSSSSACKMGAVEERLGFLNLLGSTGPTIRRAGPSEKLFSSFFSNDSTVADVGPFSGTKSAVNRMTTVDNEYKTLFVPNNKKHFQLMWQQHHSSFLEFSKPFVSAEATNTYTPAENAAMFEAKTALGPGSGYWVTDGQHGADDVVSYTASVNRRHRSKGLRINWAYAPGFVRVRVSLDGKHFQDSVCWTKNKKMEESFEQRLTFDKSRNVKAVKIDMTQPKEYKFFGINQLGLF